MTTVSLLKIFSQLFNNTEVVHTPNEPNGGNWLGTSGNFGLLVRPLSVHFSLAVLFYIGEVLHFLCQYGHLVNTLAIMLSIIRFLRSIRQSQPVSPFGP